MRLALDKIQILEQGRFDLELKKTRKLILYVEISGF